MTVKYQIRCSESDIFVLEKEDGFHLTIGCRVNPLSFGNKLAKFNTLGKAVDGAEQFCKLYSLSKEYGYHLHSTELHKDGMNPIPVPKLLELDLTYDGMRDLLEREALLHGVT